MKISVIVPAYNAERTIERCLRALSLQTVRPIEIIVVDDCSKDKTVEIARRWAKVIQNHSRKGPGEARNIGARQAKGKIIAFTDSDCIPPRNWLKSISKALLDHEVGAVGGGYSSGIDRSFWQRFCTEELYYRRRHWKGAVKTLVSNNMACRKEIFFKEGGFPEQYPVCEDMFLSYKISLKHKVLWLEGNGVKHHFKSSLLDFLKHQYFFGRESTRFFLENSKLLREGNHQGRSLHFAIFLSLLFFLSLLVGTLSFFLSNFLISKILFSFAFLFLLCHFLIYLKFALYLREADFGITDLAKAYVVFLLRDFICGPSFFDGFRLFLMDKVAELPYAILSERRS